MKKLINFMVSFLAIVTMNLFSMREDAISYEHAQNIAQEEAARKSREAAEREVQVLAEEREYRAREREADQEQRRNFARDRVFQKYSKGY